MNYEINALQKQIKLEQVFVVWIYRAGNYVLYTVFITGLLLILKVFGLFEIMKEIVS